MALIETFLLDKLDDAIKAKSSAYSTHFPPNLSQLENDCSELKEILLLKKREALSSQQRDRNPAIKEKLYRLNNEILLLKNRHYLNIETRRTVNNLHETLTEIKKELQNIPTPDEIPKKHIYRWSTRLAGPTTKIPGFDDRALERLLVSGFEAIGIVGMAGVGKTTLCQVSFGNRNVQSHFFPRIWVCMSRQPKDDPDIDKEVARRMLACLGFEDKVVDKLQGRLIFAVGQQLKGRRYLTVLDDVDEVPSYGLPERRGGTVIVTSRSRKVAEDIVGGKNLHELLPVVDNESCWDIFMGAAKKDGNGPPEDVSLIKDTIVKSIGGLPLVAKMMGQIVHKKIQNNKKQN